MQRINDFSNALEKYFIGQWETDNDFYYEDLRKFLKKFFCVADDYSMPHEVIFTIREISKRCYEVSICPNDDGLGVHPKEICTIIYKKNKDNEVTEISAHSNDSAITSASDISNLIDGMRLAMKSAISSQVDNFKNELKTRNITIRDFYELQKVFQDLSFSATEEMDELAKKEGIKLHDWEDDDE